MPHPYELHVRPPRSLLKHFFIVLPAFLSIVLYNTLNLVNELERHRSVQVRTSISDILEASTKLSGEGMCSHYRVLYVYLTLRSHSLPIHPL